MEPGTGLAILGSAIGSAKLAEKILGPTAEYLGEGLKDWTKKSVENVGKIFANAADKLGEEIDEPGAVPPKVLKGILQEGPFCDDDLATEYFGGVLASSRNETPRDNRGASFISLLARMSNYEIRAHYVFYYLFKTQFDGQPLKAGLGADLHKMRIFIPFIELGLAMDFSAAEDPPVIMMDTMYGLVRESLIGQYWGFGPADFLRSGGYWSGADEFGLVVEPSSLGVTLLFWVYGLGQLAANMFLVPDVKLPLLKDVTMPQHARKVSEESLQPPRPIPAIPVPVIPEQ